MYDVIVDVDGTIADTSHRNHYLADQDNQDWESYKALLLHDTPFFDIFFLVDALRQAGCRIILCTARSEAERADTEKWLSDWDFGSYAKLYMRPEGDHRPDSVFKAMAFQQMGLDGFCPTMVLEDRNSVVDMWRSMGLRVLHVAPGDF